MCTFIFLFLFYLKLKVFLLFHNINAGLLFIGSTKILMTSIITSSVVPRLNIFAFLNNLLTLISIFRLSLNSILQNQVFITTLRKQLNFSSLLTIALKSLCSFPTLRFYLVKILVFNQLFFEISNNETNDFNN